MRAFITCLVALFSVSIAGAEMTTEEMQARLKEIEAKLGELHQEMRYIGSDTVVDDLHDVERRRFENDLELARLNARREVVLIRAKEEEARKRTENEVLQRKLDALIKQQSFVQDLATDASKRVDNGTMLPREVASLKLQLIELDGETATLEYQMSQGGSRSGDMLSDLEVDLAGVNAVRKALEERREVLVGRYEQKLLEDELNNERAKLEQKLLQVQNHIK